jgi:dienelactone hydrolase
MALPAADETAPPAPGMVLVHGGGGTVFPKWVRMWTERGYAAIAMDTCGKGPGKREHDRSGPAGWDASFQQTEWPIEDQWTYHAVANIILAHSLLAAQPGVDGERIGLTGISWGGYLAAIAAGVDHRFRFVAPVYGCGFLGEHSAWAARLKGLGAAGRQWLEWWDPSRYVGRARMPLLWVTGNQDHFYPMDSLQKTYYLPPGSRYLCIRHGMGHGHRQGMVPREIYMFADHLFHEAPGLCRATGQGRDGDEAWATFETPVAVDKAELVVRAATNGRKPRWSVLPATWDAAEGRAVAPLPSGARMWYFNVTDNRGLCASSEHGAVETPSTGDGGSKPDASAEPEGKQVNTGRADALQKGAQ